MPTRAMRRLAAPLLVLAGAALFGAGAGGIARVDAGLEAAARPVVAPQLQGPAAGARAPHGVRGSRAPHSHRGEF